MHKIFSEASFHLFKNWKNGLKVGFTIHSSLIRTRIVDFRLILFFQRWSSLKIFYYFVLSLFEIRRYEGIWRDTVCLSRLYPLPSRLSSTNLTWPILEFIYFYFIQWYNLCNSFTAISSTLRKHCIWSFSGPYFSAFGPREGK